MQLLSDPDTLRFAAYNLACVAALDHYGEALDRRREVAVRVAEILNSKGIPAEVKEIFEIRTSAGLLAASHFFVWVQRRLEVVDPSRWRITGQTPDPVEYRKMIWSWPMYNRAVRVIDCRTITEHLST